MFIEFEQAWENGPASVNPHRIAALYPGLEAGPAYTVIDTGDGVVLVLGKYEDVKARIDKWEETYTDPGPCKAGGS